MKKFMLYRACTVLAAIAAVVAVSGGNKF